MQPIATDVACRVVCVSACVCVSVFWAHRWAVQKQISRSRCCLGLTHVGSINHY